MRKQYYRPQHHRGQLRPYAAIAIETTAKLTVNVVLSAVAISCLVRLLPHHQSVRDRLVELQTQVKRKEQRVNRLQQEFKHNFSLDRSINVMEEQSHRVDKKRRPIVLRNAVTVDDAEPAIGP